MNHERTLHERVRRIQEISFFDETAQSPYPVDRGLWERPVIGLPHEFLPGYLTYLPQYNGKNFINILDQKIEEKGNTRLLDVGCGSGRFLIDCKGVWGGKLTAVGASAYPYHEVVPQNYRVTGLPMKPNYWELKANDISIAIGDAHNLKKVLEENGINNKFDIIVSVMTLGYLDNPLLVLKNIYDLLDDGGFGLVQHFDPLYTMSQRTFNFVKQELTSKYGFQIGNDSFAFQKQHSHLSIPVSLRLDGRHLRYVPKSK